MTPNEVHKCKVLTVGVPHLGFEFHFGGTVGVVFGELELRAEVTTLQEVNKEMRLLTNVRKNA